MIKASLNSITMQDLYDTLRNAEALPANMDNDYIIDGSGKEPLGADVYVGLTLSLNNAQIEFEARPSPNWVQCRIDGGNLVAFDASRNEMNAIHPTMYTQVIQSNASSATLQGQDVNSIANAVWAQDVSGYTDFNSAGNILWNNTKRTINKIIPFLFR